MIQVAHWHILLYMGNDLSRCERLFADNSKQ